MGRVDIDADNGTFKTDLIFQGRSSVLTFKRRALSFASDANKTLTSSEYDALFLDFTSAGSLTATRDVILPLTDGAFFNIYNNTTGGQSIRAIGSSGTGITIASTKSAMVRCDGTNYIRVTADV